MATRRVVDRRVRADCRGGVFAVPREDSPARSIHASNRARPPPIAPPIAARRATSRQTPRRPALQPICNHQIPNHIADEPRRRPLAHSDASALGSPLPRRANSGLGSPEPPPILGIAFLSAAHSRQALQPLNPHPAQANPWVSIGTLPLRGVFLTATGCAAVAFDGRVAEFALRNGGGRGNLREKPRRPRPYRRRAPYP